MPPLSDSRDPLASLNLESLASCGNKPIPAAQALVIHTEILNAERELTEMNNEIQSLEARRNSLLSRLEVYRVAVAPHKILPVDILCAIFSFCAPRPAEIHSIVNNRRWMDTRLIICQICSHWRSVALGMNVLWSDVDVDMSTGNVMRILEVLDAWLSRSGGCALSLKVTSTNDDPLVSELLTRYSPQCRTLFIGDIRLPNSFFAQAPGSMGRLEKLTIKGSYGYFERRQPPGHQTISVFADAPFLRSVTLESFFDHLNLGILEIPWRQLTEIYFSNITPTPAQYYSILDGCEDVKVSRMDVFPTDSSGTIELSECQIALPALETLELNTDVLGNAARFLQSIALDSLVDLSLSLSDDPDGTIFTVRPFPALKSFSIFDASDISETDLETWLRACPAAVDVWLPDFPMTPRLVEQIADGRLLPRVQLLAFGSTVPSVLIPALEARQRSVELSTITEVGLTQTPKTLWQLDSSEAERVAGLGIAGVFLSACSSAMRPLPGQIKQLARFKAQQGLGVYVHRELPTG
ncbi:hypothetical protein B0H11DRAFT_2141227 [Mycena galericulata]|nr:hypothetical protein B0H11DRAFT_2141227 [Mycena galericulata]